jgi:adenylate cyclase, class 2
MFEVEKRAFIEPKNVKLIKSILDKKAVLVNNKKFQTLLYPKPYYLRIRWADDKKGSAQITVKKGNYKDAFREEHEISVDVKEIKNFTLFFETLGFNKCSYFKSEWFGYEYKGFKIDLTKHEYLGTLLEVEKITYDKKAIKSINKQIHNIMNELGLIELRAAEYQKMMNKMYKESIKPVKLQKIRKVHK